MCELTLTETATMVNLAKHAMESFEATEESDKEGAKAHHSDDEVTSSSASALGFKSLKSVRSEPVLKNKDGLDDDGAVNGPEQRLQAPCKSDSSFGSELGIQFVASSADSPGSAKNLSVC